LLNFFEILTYFLIKARKSKIGEVMYYYGHSQLHDYIIFHTTDT
jgi:hypothetical protein